VLAQQACRVKALRVSRSTMPQRCSSSFLLPASVCIHNNDTVTCAYTKQCSAVVMAVYAAFAFVQVGTHVLRALRALLCVVWWSCAGAAAAYR
jgi:Ca2+/H+ antiporter